jgi:hypothetical protein
MPVLRLMTADGRSVERDFDLPEGPVTIGRADINTIIVDDVSISRRHATIESTTHGYRLIDERSANGVFLRNRRITDAIAASGETFRLGQRWFQIVDDGAVSVSDAPATRSSAASWIGASCLLMLLGFAVCVGAVLIYLSRDAWAPRPSTAGSGSATSAATTSCSSTPAAAPACPWSAGSPAGTCAPGFCFDGGPQGTGECKQQSAPASSHRDDALDVACDDGFTARRDCTNAVLACER